MDVTSGRAVPRPATFSTVGLPPARRLELWERYNAHALVGLDCRTIDGRPLSATQHNLWLPNVEIAQVTGNPHVIERTLGQIGRHPVHSVLLYVALAGEAFFYHQDGVLMLRPGQAVLCDGDTPFVRGFAQGLTELVLKVPRTLFDGLAEGTAPRGPRVFDAEPVPALTTLMRSALRTAPDERTESDLLGLLRALVVGARAGGAPSQLRAAQSFIERHLTDRDLSAGRVAAAVGISERQVSRVFGEYGGVARWITDRRLDLAGELLAAARPGAVSVGDVARRCGFASQSYFARAFRQRFARTPLEVLRTFPPSA